MAKSRSTILSSKIFNEPSQESIDLNTESDNTTLIQDVSGVKPIGSSVIEKALSNATTPQEVDAGIELGKEVQEDASKNKKIIDILNEPLKTKVFTPENPNVGTGKTLLGAIKFDKYAPKGVPELTTSEIQQALIEQEPDVKQQMIDEYKNYTDTQRKNAVSPAIERMGIQDYYPDLQNQIHQGTYSGRIVGNVPIYVAQGGLLPMTIIDARKRAMEKQAMETQKKIDDIKSKRFVTSEQYQRQYDDAYFDDLNGYIEMVDGDIEFLTDPSTALGREFLEKQSRWESLYKENKYVDGVADDILARQAKGEYIPPPVLQDLDNWNTGRIPMDSWVNGEENVSNLADRFKAYQNMITWADEKLPEFRLGGKMQMPIRPDLDLTNPEIAKNAKEALVFKSGQSNDQYITGLRKYYDTEAIENIVDGAFSQNNFYKGRSSEEEKMQKGILLNYLVNSLGEEIELKVDITANDKLERDRLALDKQKLAWDKEKFTLSQAVSYNQMIDDDVKGVAKDFIQALNNNPKLSNQQRKQLLEQYLTQQGAHSKEGSRRVGVQVSEVPMTKPEMNKIRADRTQKINISYGGKNYKLSDVPNQVALAKRNNDTKAQKFFEEWEKVYNDAGAGELKYYANRRYVTPMSISNKEGKKVERFGEYVDPNGEIHTANIFEITEYETTDDEGNVIVKKLPSSATVFSDLSNPATIASMDADDINTSTTAKKGEVQRQGGVVTSRTTTTRR